MSPTRRLSLVVAMIAAAGLLSGFARSTPAPAHSAVRADKHMLFRVRGTNGATVYLLGSVHLLDAQSGKLPEVVDSAYAHAKSVAFEMNLDSAKMRSMEIMTRGQFAPGQTLSGNLSPAGRARVDTVLKQYGLAIQQVDRFKPWLVSLLMTNMVLQKAQFQPQFGVDVQINERAKQTGKPIVTFESVDFQFGMFDRISAGDQEKMITSSVGPDSSAVMLKNVKDAWMVGDASMLDSLLNLTNNESPSLFATMVSDRNKNWIPKIEEMLKGKDDALVVVGAAHLVGSQGVLALLKAKGYTIEQM